jgi:flagellar biosynthesis protein FlhA
VQTVGADGSGIEPGLADTLLRETASAARRQEEIGLPAVLLVPGGLRWLLSHFLRRAVPQLKVLANPEVPDSRTIKVTSIIGGK